MHLHEVQPGETQTKIKTVKPKGADAWSWSKAPPVNLSIMGVGFATLSLALTVSQYFSASWTIQPKFVGTLQTDPESDKLPCSSRNNCADCSANGKCVFCFSAGQGSSCKEGSSSGPKGIVSCPDWTFGAKKCHGFADKHYGPFVTCTSESGTDYTCLDNLETGGTCAVFEAEQESSGYGKNICQYILAGEKKKQCEAIEELCGYNGNWIRLFIALNVAAETLALAAGLVLVMLPFMSSVKLDEDKAKVKQVRQLFVFRTKALAWTSGTSMVLSSVFVLTTTTTWNDIDSAMYDARKTYCRSRDTCNYLGSGFFLQVALIVCTVAGSMIFCAFPSRYQREQRDLWNAEIKQKWGKHGRQPKSNPMVASQFNEMKKMGLDPDSAQDIEEYNQIVELRLKSNAQIIEQDEESILKAAMLSSMTSSESTRYDMQYADAYAAPQSASPPPPSPPPQPSSSSSSSYPNAMSSPLQSSQGDAPLRKDSEARIQWALKLSLQEAQGDDSSSDEEGIAYSRSPMQGQRQEQSASTGEQELAAPNVRFFV